jgi:hypothetical protein
MTNDIASDIIKRMRARVLDTDALVAAFRSDAGASRRVLDAALARSSNCCFRYR